MKKKERACNKRIEDSLGLVKHKTRTWGRLLAWNSFKWKELAQRGACYRWFSFPKVPIGSSQVGEGGDEISLPIWARFGVDWRRRARRKGKINPNFGWSQLSDNKHEKRRDREGVPLI